MKKIACLVLAASLAMFAAGCGGSPAGGEGESAAPLTGVTLNVFNWGEYIDDEDYKVNDRFTFETGIKVNYKNFTDNESMYAVISSSMMSCSPPITWWGRCARKACSRR